MNTTLTTWPLHLCNTLKTRILFLLLIGFSTLPLTAQQNSIPCNAHSPLVNNGIFTVTEDHSAGGLACWEGDGLCFGNDIPADVINSSLTDFATGTMVVNGLLTLRVSDLNQVYSAGNLAGFVIESGLLNTGLFNSITISTYLNDDFRESYSAIDLLTLDSDLLSGPFPIGFVTTMDFNEIEIEIDDDLGIGIYHVYYAFMERYCLDEVLVDCNVEVAMNRPGFPTRIDYENTGSDGISVGTVDDPEDAVSSETTDFASLINLASVTGSTFLTIEEMVTDYPAGTYVGFDIENLTLLGAGVLNYITITSYLGGVQQQEISGPDLLAGVPLLSGSGRHTVGFVTTTEVDKVKITVEQPAGVTLGTTRVYSAIFQLLCEGELNPCNEETSITKPEFPVYIDVEHTGFSGVGCVGCSVANEGNVIDPNTSNYASIVVVNGAVETGSLSVVDALTDYPAGVFTGFRIENVNLVDADVLAAINITTYLDGDEQENAFDLDALVTVGSGLLINEDQFLIGFVTSLPFDEVKITVADLVTVDVGTVRVFELIIQNLCEPEVECNQTYFWTTENFPVYIDQFLTGPDGIACALCTVDEPENAIDSDTSNYSTIFALADVLGSVSLAVKDALYEYPPGTFAGFVIDDLGSLIEAELFDLLTISTYNDGDFQESRTGGDLIDLGLLILFISADEGRYNVGFRTTMSFDEIRISVLSVASLPNTVRVYSAFVDTRTSDGGDLECIDPPVANDDNAETDEDESVDIDVLDNDEFGDNPIDSPVVTDDPNHGTTSVNPDSTITYTPDSNFVGIDTFTYQICDDQDLCDEAQVIVVVNPVIDTIYETIPEDSSFTVCAGELTTFNTPAETVSECGGPSNGTLAPSVDGECITYQPGPEYSGQDTFCLVTCHPDDPDLCDTTIVIMTITPVIDPPIANDDNAETDEDESVDIDVLDNDVYGDNPLDPPVVTDDPNHGTTSVNPDSTITYTPDSNFVGIDTFTYQICDDQNQCDDAEVIIIVNPVIDTIEETIPEDSTFTVCATELTTFNEPAETVSECEGPSNGSLIPSDEGDCITYEPNPEFVGIDTFCLVVCHPDDPSLCDTTIVIITVTPVNDPPDAVDDIDTTGINEEVTIDVLDNDSDPDSPLGEPVIDDEPLNGEVVVNADSTVTYTPDEDFVGVDSFTYFICDAGVPVLCDTATVVVWVLPDRDTIIEELPVDSILEVCVSFLTELGNPVIMTVCDSPSNSIIILIDTCLMFIPDPGFEGNDTACVVICDSLGPCDTTTIIIIVEIPLPVTLMSFDARKSGNTSVLTWKTAVEYNSDYFEVQRAGENQLFSTIAIVESAGYSPSQQRYDYIDESPHAGVFYYRLRMMDIDGRTSFSPIRSVAFSGEDLKVRLWPNPVQGELNIETKGGVAEPGKLTIIDSDGRIVLEQPYHFNQQKSNVDLSRVGPGLYTVVFQSAQNYSTQKLVVF